MPVYSFGVKLNLLLILSSNSNTNAVVNSFLHYIFNSLISISLFMGNSIIFCTLSNLFSNNSNSSSNVSIISKLFNTTLLS